MPESQLTGVVPLVEIVARFWRFIFRGRVLQVVVLLFVMCLAAAMEMATLAAIVSLVSTLVDDPESSTALWATRLPEFIAQSEHAQSYVLAGVVLIVCVSAFLRILVIRMTGEFSAKMGLHLQSEYFRITIHADYEDIVNESSSQKISMMTTKIPFIVATYILGVLTLTTSLISAIGIIAMLIWLSTGVVIFALLILTMAYVVVAYYSRHKLSRYGRDIGTNNPKSVQYLQDSLGGIREVIMASSQGVYVKRFTGVARRVEVAKARLMFYSGFPRPVLEAIAISCIAIMALFINMGAADGAQLLPMLGAFSLGLLRLLPYVQQVYSQWSRMYHSLSMLQEVMRAMDDFRLPPDATSPAIPSAVTAMSFQSGIELRHAGFAYREAERAVLQDVTLRIEKGDYVGIVGPTGSGKSTLVDLIMGLLTPSEGMLLVDDIVINQDNRSQWRNKVAHVPQRVYLADGSIAENIAFAVPDEEVDLERVKLSAQQAHIAAYVESLPEGYQTSVGENGVRLSGGQRQRLGIARALYAQCEVMVFDEATNALDARTEEAIINELRNLSKALTIIAVAHNEAAIKHCSHILRVDQGDVVRITRD